MAETADSEIALLVGARADVVRARMRLREATHAYFRGLQPSAAARAAYLDALRGVDEARARLVEARVLVHQAGVWTAPTIFAEA